tara:strand:+ start:1518 stop:1727 length:210 start_codon:yes stop_codon:yes gene_type:complete
MEKALSQVQRPDRTRPDVVGNGGSAGVVDNVGVDQEPAIDRQPLNRNRQSLWAKRRTASASAHEGHQPK